tara:strand:- start:73 stop:933 length:861 start_codon:yes stop_codon:yes gene_type:complete
MATLTGNPINTSYPGLLKTLDNAVLPVGGGTVSITDGEGNQSGLNLGQNTIGIAPDGGYIYDVGAENGFYYDNISVKPSGTWDFTSATVNNLNIGVESVVAGTNVTIDNTDPANPIVSAAGGGGGSPTFTLPAFVQAGEDQQDVCYAVALIPANTFGLGDVLELRSLEQRTGLTGTAYESYWFSTQAQTAGQPVNYAGTGWQQAGIQSSNNGSLYYQKTMYINASGTGVWNYGGANETYDGAPVNGDPAIYQAVDWTVNQYFYYQIWQESTTGSVTNFGTVLRKIN